MRNPGSRHAYCVYYADNHQKLKEVVSKFDLSSNQAIQKTLDALNSNTVCQHLAFIKLHFESLPKLINRLETQGMKLCEAVNEVVGFMNNASSWPGENGKAVRMKLEAVLEKNPGRTNVVEISKMLNGETSTLQPNHEKPASNSRTEHRKPSEKPIILQRKVRYGNEVVRLWPDYSLKHDASYKGHDHLFHGPPLYKLYKWLA